MKDEETRLRHIGSFCLSPQARQQCATCSHVEFTRLGSKTDGQKNARQQLDDCKFLWGSCSPWLALNCAAEGAFGARGIDCSGIFSDQLQDRVHVATLVGEALDITGQFASVPPIPGTLVVNIGECLQRSSNHVHMGKIHRVVNNSKIDRYSAVYFIDPHPEAIIQVLDSCVSESSAKKICQHHGW